jgi:hypothetical protein
MEAGVVSPGRFSCKGVLGTAEPGLAVWAWAGVGGAVGNWVVVASAGARGSGRGRGLSFTLL